MTVEDVGLHVHFTRPHSGTPIRYHSS